LIPDVVPLSFLKKKKKKLEIIMGDLQVAVAKRKLMKRRKRRRVD
jgi:hypothetical protein